MEVDHFSQAFQLNNSALFFRLENSSTKILKCTLQTLFFAVCVIHNCHIQLKRHIQASWNPVKMEESLIHILLGLFFVIQIKKD